MDLLRLATSGSVDDGKSTLIGRLLYDTKSIYEDQLRLLEATSARRAHAGIDLSLLTDGLRAERDQGITIDVAYRYFSTPKRKFVLADTPGHVQYTRNMVTGASNADAILLLIDARKGVVEQTKRHALLASLMRVRHAVVCINKMDLVEHSEKVFNAIRADFAALSEPLGFADVSYVPMSALNGDNVVTRSRNMPWYDGPALLEQLESIDPSEVTDEPAARFLIQCVQRPGPRSRRYLGLVAAGVFRQGDEILALPSGLKTKIGSIENFSGPMPEAQARRSVSIGLADELDLGRGDMLSSVVDPARVTQDLEVVLCWMDKAPLNREQRYDLLHATSETQCLIKDVRFRYDVHTLTPSDLSPTALAANDIARVQVRAARPLAIDPYRTNRLTGSVLLVDQATHHTAAAGVIVE